MRTDLLSASLLLAAFIISPFAHGQLDAPLPRLGMMGAAFGPVPATKSKELKLKADQGQVVQRIVANGSAAKAGLLVGDIVLEINGFKLSNKSPLAQVVPKLKANAPLKFSILRNGQKETISGVLFERPKQSSPDFETEYLQVVSRGKRIRVITTHPKGGGKFPTVMLLGGIGGYSVDGNFETAPYGNVIGPVANAGYATIRIDKPGQGDSEGPAYTDLRFADEFDAYLQALRLAKTLSYVDASRIGLFGHSMGGVFAPLLASQEPVAAVAVSGTLAKTWIEYSIENVRRQSALAGASPVDLDQEMKRQAAVATYLYYEKLSPAEIVRRRPELRETMAQVSPDGKSSSGVGIPFFQEVAAQNFVQAWSNVKADALILWGATDFVSTRFDHEYLADFLNKRRPGSATLRILENSDHGFNNTKTMLESMQKWGAGGAPHNPNIEETLIEWFGKILKKK